MTSKQDARRILRNQLGIRRLSSEQRELALSQVGRSEGASRRNLGRYAEEQVNASKELKNDLKRWGLGGLWDWAWQQINRGTTPEQVLQSLTEQDEFRQRFAPIFQREAKGLPPLAPTLRESIQAVLGHEAAVTASARYYHLGANFFSREEMHEQLVNDVSAVEVRQRLDEWNVVARNSPIEVRRELNRLYGIGEDEILAYFVDPDKALPQIQTRVARAGIAAQAQNAGFGDISNREAAQVQRLGFTAATAAQGFSDLATDRELFSALPGTQEKGIGRGAQFGAAFEGDALSKQKIEKRRSERKATFEGGGAFASSREGVSGL